MGDNGAFGFDPDDLDRVLREGSEGLRDAVERIGKFLTAPGVATGWSAVFDDRSRRSRPAPETAGEAKDPEANKWKVDEAWMHGDPPAPGDHDHDHDGDGNGFLPAEPGKG